MKSLSELKSIVLNALDDTILYEVETSIDTDGGYYFSSLEDAFNYLSRVIKAQTNTELFECEDFEKIDYIQVTIHFSDNNNENMILLSYVRKNDTEFIETVLI